MRNGSFVAGLLAGAAVAGAIVFATQPLPDDVAARPARSTAGSVPSARQAPADAVADRLQRWTATSLARPLFNPNQRPVAVAEAGSNAAAGLPRLSGIMITEAGRRAIFAATGAAKLQVVVEGDTVGGNLVRSISVEEVVLVGPDGPHRLHLAFDRQSPGASMVPPTVAGQEATPGTTQEAAAPQETTPPGNDTPEGDTPRDDTPGNDTPGNETLRRQFQLWLLLLAVAGCDNQTAKPAALTPLPELPGDTGVAAPRINGYIGTPQAGTAAQTSYGQAETVHQPAGFAVATAAGDISLEFADTDIREVVAQILGSILHVNYTIDPAVRGTVTLRTAAPLTRAQLIPALETLLSQNGATMVQAGELYRVLPSAAMPGIAASGPSTAGAAVVPLRYAQADDLVKALQPFVGAGGRVVAVPGNNALLISGEPDARNSLVELVRAFDVNTLAGQSYALLPVTSGGARDFATQLQEALRSEGSSTLASQVRVVPMDRVDAVLVIASRAGYIEGARRIYALVERARRSTVRSWYVYYLQNSRSNDIANVLQRAFTPNNVTAQPTTERQPGSTAPGMATQIQSGSAAAGAAPGASTPGMGATPGSSGAGGLGAGAATTPQPAQSDQSAQVSASPLLGGTGQGNGSETDVDAMRIVPNPQNNAILIYGTREEEDTVVAMLRKIDILPLQVRIDATVAEVNLNDALRYGTQYYFKQGGLNGVLTAAFAPGVPGFFVAGNNSAQIAIAALQAVTEVHVLSSPQLLVLDNQPARLEVGDLVPYLTSSSQGTLVAGSPVINSIAYQQTGVILDVTPRVNGGGLVTLDISQEVSEIDPTVTTTGISSPAFSDRNVHSRVVVQDGQTIGLAGLIQDSMSRGNSGLPWLKNIPVLGALFGQQNNSRTRTELLILVTPHVMHDQRDARDLTEDLREHLSGAAGIPAELQRLKPSGSADPNAPLLDRTRPPP